MKDKLNITIRIADLPPIAMEIRRDEEPDIRTAEHQVNLLWKSWSKRFSEKSPHEVLAMVAFQFAKAFTLQNRYLEDTEAMIDNFEQQLDKMLLEAAGATSADEHSDTTVS
ncbi:MAG: cell division protein ZapA [Muribaculaceae bacterium]|nr:cell division protein ZapA [Muribaculaceae bacterium]